MTIYDYYVVNESLYQTKSISDIKISFLCSKKSNQSDSDVFSQRTVCEMTEYIVHMPQYNNQKTITLHRVLYPVTIPVTITAVSTGGGRRMNH